MTDLDCVMFLQEVLPRLGLSWRGFRRVRGQVCKRIARRLRVLELPSLEAYQARLANDPQEWAVLDGLCRVTLSRFYRDRAVYDRLREVYLPRQRTRAAQERRRVRLWSAGCASGEEPYTLGLILRLGVQPAGPFHIVATDVDPVVLGRAREACYAGGTLRELPSGWRERAFALQDGRWCLMPEYRADIEFRCADIREAMPEGPFDSVLCRNLAFTYFAPSQQEQILAGIAERMVSGGVLVIGAHESMPLQEGWSLTEKLPIYERIER